MEKGIVTLGRQYGSGGRAVGAALAERLGVPFYDRELIQLAAEKSGVDPGILAVHNEKAVQATLVKMKGSPGGLGGKPVGELLYQLQSQIILELAEKGSCVIIGRCADYVLRDRKELFSVFITAPAERRIERIMERNRMGREDAARAIEKVDRQRSDYSRHYTGKEWGSQESYGLLVDSSERGIEGTAAYLEEILRGQGRFPA